jgi:hypothetical protein
MLHPQFQFNLQTIQPQTRISYFSEEKREKKMTAKTNEECQTENSELTFKLNNLKKQI